MSLRAERALRAALYGLAGGLIAALAVGVPTVLIPNPWFSRMTPTHPRDYAVLGATALLAALLGASYAFPAACPIQEGKATLGGFLSFLAVGCPVCNKAVVLLLGTSGALGYFAPLQPLLAVAGLGLLALALWLRVRGVRAARPEWVGEEPAEGRPPTATTP